MIMIGRATAACLLLMFLWPNANAALVEGSASVNGSITLSSYSGDLADVTVVGLASEILQTEFQFGSGVISSFNTPGQSFTLLGIGDTVATVVEATASVNGPVGGATKNIEENLVFAVTNTSASPQTAVIDVLVDYRVAANDNFDSALAGGNAFFVLSSGLTSGNVFSDSVPLAEDFLFVQSSGGIGPLAQQMLFAESISFEIDPFESLGISLYTGVVAAALSPVPLPATAWLFASAMVGLLGLRRRRSDCATIAS